MEWKQILTTISAWLWVRRARLAKAAINSVLVMLYCSTIFKKSCFCVDKKQMSAAKLFPIFLLALVSCSDGGGLAGRPLIQKFGGSGSSGGEGPVCLRFYHLDDGSCLTECKEETHAATDAEKEEVVKSVKDSELEEARKQEVLGHIESAEAVCVAGTGILRPDNAIFVNRDYCICLSPEKNGPAKPDSLNNCSAFCSKKANIVSPMLYGSVELGEEVVNNPRLGNLKNWCTVELSPEYTDPGCVLELIGESGRLEIPLVIPFGSNNFSTNLSTVEYETPYLARIVEVKTGVSSDSFQIYRKKFPEDSSFSSGPLAVVPVSQYHCLKRARDTDEVHTFYTNVAKNHFYFVSGRSPKSVSPGNDEWLCHNARDLGLTDSPLYERLGLNPKHFMVWDESDIRFYDQDGFEGADINHYIRKVLLEDHGVQSNDNFFSLFNWLTHPEVEKASNLGFILQPWVDSSTGRGLCPTEEDYNGNVPVFKVLRDLVGVNTEGLYVAEREALSSLDAQGKILEIPSDVLFIREKLLKKIWFYFEQGKYFIPDEVTATQKNIYFYWPPDIKYPYVRKSDQHIYTVKLPENIGKTEESSGLNKSVRTPDKRLGCVPSLGEPKP